MQLKVALPYTPSKIFREIDGEQVCVGESFPQFVYPASMEKAANYFHTEATKRGAHRTVTSYYELISAAGARYRFEVDCVPGLQPFAVDFLLPFMADGFSAVLKI
jgi:hypothetical protein